jgi:TatD DNase family protein
MIIDTHSHVNFKDFKDDFEEVFARAKAAGVAQILVGSQISTGRRAIELAKNRDITFAAVGLHPLHLMDMEIEEEHAKFKTRGEEFDFNVYKELAEQDKVVAIGEVGLDYYHLPEAEFENLKNKQQQVFREQIKLANEVGLPMIIHVRGNKETPDDAYEDILKIFQTEMPAKRGVLHCYTASWQLAEKFLDLGFYLGFNGIVTFDKTGRLEELLIKTPIDKILSETDCPYLTPEPFRGKRNEPAYVEYVVKKIAEVKRLDYDSAAKLTLNNAKKLFDLAI